MNTINITKDTNRVALEHLIVLGADYTLSIKNLSKTTYKC